jgi:hypothetical protein
MNPAHRLAACALLLCVMPWSAQAQDLNDPATLRTFNIVFHDANWLTLLRQNYASETNIFADLTVDGVTYPQRLCVRGNISYTALPAGSDKFSLKIYMDFADAEQELLGYDSLNLNNGFHDPTFSREVVYSNYVAQFIPNPRANNVVVTSTARAAASITTCSSRTGACCATISSTPTACASAERISQRSSLAYNGTAASGCTAYQIQADGGLADPFAALIAVSNFAEQRAARDLAEHRHAVRDSQYRGSVRGTEVPRSRRIGRGTCSSHRRCGAPFPAACPHPQPAAEECRHPYARASGKSLGLCQLDGRAGVAAAREDAATGPRRSRTLAKPRSGSAWRTSTYVYD